tara:strand:+ start:406 stop:843 length:438 start_codon:yes stop_codon:yes gene_type:complete
MASGIINGTNLLVSYDAGTGTLYPIGYSTSCTLSITQETRNTTNSTSAGWNTRIVGDRDWEVSVDALVSMTTNNPNLNFYAIFLNHIAPHRDKFLLRFGNDLSGDTFYQGEAYVTGMEITGSNEETATYSVTFIAAGPLVQSANP